MQAFAVPIKPDKVETWKAWCGEMTGPRKDDFEDLNRRYGLTTHAAFHEPLPDGNHLAVIVLDGPGADSFMEKLATSENETDAWFRSSIEDVHPMDFSNIPPAPTRML